MHCDPTIPSGAGDIGGGNTYSRSLLHELQKITYTIFILHEKISEFRRIHRHDTLFWFYRINLGNWGPIDKDILQNYHSYSKQLVIEILSKYNDCSFIFHSIYWQSGMLAYELAEQYNTFYVHTILSNGKKKQLAGAVEDIVKQRIHEEEKYLHMLNI